LSPATCLRSLEGSREPTVTQPADDGVSADSGIVLSVASDVQVASGGRDVSPDVVSRNTPTDSRSGLVEWQADAGHYASG
jgi:hypothetical protein